MILQQFRILQLASVLEEQKRMESDHPTVKKDGMKVRDIQIKEQASRRETIALLLKKDEVVRSKSYEKKSLILLALL